MSDMPLGRKRKLSDSSSSTSPDTGGATATTTTTDEGAKNAKQENLNRSAGNAGGGGNPVPPDMLSAHSSHTSSSSSSSSSGTSGNNNGLTYSGTYGKMYLVPESFYHTMMNGSSNLIKNLHEDKIKQHVDAARTSANNPKAYQYHMIQANILKHATVANPHIDQRIQLSLTNPAIQQLDQKISSYKRNPRLFKTDIGMKQYNAFQTERRIKLDVLQDEENKKYNNIISNPADNITALPASLQTRSHHATTLKSFLAKHPNLINEDEHGNVFVENKLVAHGDENKNHLSRMIHYMMHDYESSPTVGAHEYKQHAPQGLIPFVEALHRRGFSYENIGNRYLRKAMVTPSASSSSSSSSSSLSSSTAAPTSGTPTTPSSHEQQLATLRTRLTKLQEMLEYHKSQGNSEKRRATSRLMIDNMKHQNKLVEEHLRRKQQHHTSGAATAPSRLSTSAESVRQRLSSYLSEKQEDHDDTPTTRQLKVLRPTERRLIRIQQRKLTKKY